jgi:hypothetical protein
MQRMGHTPGLALRGNTTYREPLARRPNPLPLAARPSRASRTSHSPGRWRRATPTVSLYLADPKLPRRMIRPPNASEDADRIERPMHYPSARLDLAHPHVTDRSAHTLALLPIANHTWDKGWRLEVSDVSTANTSVAQQIMMIRHAEKPRLAGPPQGVDDSGVADEHSLTVHGWTTAGAILGLFASPDGATRPNLARPTAIFAAGGTGGQGERPGQTVVPLAARLRLSVETQYAKGDELALAKDATSRTGASLICWQHEELPTLAAAFANVSPDPPSGWPDSRFDIVWVLLANYERPRMELHPGTSTAAGRRRQPAHLVQARSRRW